MITQRISTDAVITDPDSDFENVPSMSSPATSSFSQITTSSNGGEDRSALPNPENHIENSDREEDQEEAAPLPPLTSFIPIIETLPGLVLEDNTYYVGTPLIRRNVETLISYARRVEELVLTDSGRDQHPRVSQDTLTRLAHVRDVNNPSSPSLLSSLKRLRLIDVDSELAYLWFCLTPSLQLLEVSGIPPARHTTIATFLDELVSNAPRLAHLTLGPGRLFTRTLQVSLRFEHLRELRIDDAVDTVDFVFLQAVAALPELALFDIDARTAEYIPYTPAAMDVEATEGRDTVPPVIDDAEHVSTGTGTEEDFLPFLRLTTLAITGNVILMHDLLHRLLPRGVERLSLTLVRCTSLSIPAHWTMPPPTSPDAVGTAVENVLEVNNAAVLALIASLSAEAVSVLPAAGVDEVPYHILWDTWGFQTVCKGDRSLIDEGICPQCKEKQRLRLNMEKQERLKVQKSSFLFQATLLALMIDQVLDYASLKSVHINLADTLSSSIISTECTSPLFDPPELPPSTLRKLLSCPSLVKLQVENWILTSANKTILDLQNTLELPLPMQVLHLPIKESLHSGIALSTLPSVARLYPHLLNFRIRLVECARVHARELELCVIDHGLKELSFSAEAPGNIEDMMEIAPYIYLLFPHIARIASCGDHDAEGWKSVSGLVKMCQKVIRNTEKKHLIPVA